MSNNLLDVIAARQLPNDGFIYVSLCLLVTYNAHIYIDGPGTSSKNQMFLSWPRGIENEENEKSLFHAARYDKWMPWSNLYATQVTRPFESKLKSRA